MLPTGGPFFAAVVDFFAAALLLADFFAGVAEAFFAAPFFAATVEIAFFAAAFFAVAALDALSLALSASAGAPSIRNLVLSLAPASQAGGFPRPWSAAHAGVALVPSIFANKIRSFCD
ncbi:hypothetical protein [Caballeronia cordobensis]|uniref:hypothetical protein n=1 Tax=Caballeronia cordobensis TaxID=1353886 RepID=UPI0006AD65C1|nr:hypothetical protein [Caballeronia cordobensis]